jgi:hypothetical protein
MAKKKTPKKKTPKKKIGVKKAPIKKAPVKKTPVKKAPPINWLRDWDVFDFSGDSPGTIAIEQARVEQIAVEFLSRQNGASDPRNWHFIKHDYWDISGTDYRYVVYLRPPVKDNGGGEGTVSPPAPTQPPPPNLS